MAVFGISNPLGWYAFLSVIPLILLYLIRPRPKEMSIPSLMFFMKAGGVDRRKSFLRNFIRDPLFLIQLLLLLLLSYILVGPFMWVSAETISNSVALVIDVSASSQVKELGGMRFDITMEEARRLLGSKNTIVLARSAPEILLKNGNRGEATELLKIVRPTDERSKIGDAILLAGEILGNSGRVFVISDFKNTEGADPILAANALKSRGLAVELIDVSGLGKKNNVGIIDVDVEDDSTSVFVKNYNDADQVVNLKVGSLAKSLSIPAGGVETFAFKTPAGITKVEIDRADDFLVDNVAHISTPEDRQIKVLLITNSNEVFLRSALSSADYISVDISEPPIIKEGDYDVYVIDGVDSESVITGTFSKIEEKIKLGAALVINAQSNSDSIGYQRLLPVELMDKKGKAVLVVNQATMFTKDVEFGRVDSYFDAELKQGSTTVVSADNVPIVSFSKIGAGNVLYYGILDDSSDFKLSPYYPIFWVNALKFLTEQEEVGNLNLRTGDTFLLKENEKVKMPDGDIESGAFVLEQVGVYTIGNKKISANLISDKESNINLGGDVKKSISEITIEKSSEKFPKKIEMELLIAIAILLFLELLYVKSRGDL